VVVGVVADVDSVVMICHYARYVVAVAVVVVLLVVLVILVVHDMVLVVVVAGYFPYGKWLEKNRFFMFSKNPKTAEIHILGFQVFYLLCNL